MCRTLQIKTYRTDVLTSAFGTKRTSRSPQLMSAFGVKRTCAGRTSMRPRSNMKLNPEDLAKITDFTLSHYNERAEDFWEGTRDHNVNQNIAALLQSIEGEPPYTILDFGCGPGRDMKVFAELGHIAVDAASAP